MLLLLLLLLLPPLLLFRLMLCLFQFLFVTKLAAAVLSGSLAIISSVLDNGMDLLSGALLWGTTIAMKKQDVINYPSGKFDIVLC